MYIKLIKNDFRKNPWNHLILFLFISLAATIAVTVTLMLTQLFTSISAMYETSNPPHFLQMHKGELSQPDLDEFNRSYDGIVHWQTVPMINLYGEEITVSAKIGKDFSLADCRLDISFVKQNEGYDVLLDENRKPLEIQEGEIGVPVILLDEFDISIGNTITLQSGTVLKTFTVAAYVYDGQMNSTLCSSTRFLISDSDFDELSGTLGETEYLIEAWFADSGQASEYQTAYEQSPLNLPKNGQAVTYTMIFLLSALTDLMMAMVFLLAGVLLIVIALICLRYAILAELEEDMQSIGTMKAMGISKKGIGSLYLGKIRVLTISGCALGVLAGLMCMSTATNHISRTFGSQSMELQTLGLAILVDALVYLIILLTARKILSRLGKSTVIDLLVTGKGFGHTKKVRDGIRSSRHLPINLLMGLHEVRQGYGIVFGLLLIISLLIMVPLRTVQTMENDEFVTYMGSPECDLLLEVEQGEALEERNTLAETLLLKETEQGAIQKMNALRRVRLQAIRDDGEIVGIHIDTGENSGAGLKYLFGENPKNNTEIALSYLMADELELNVGEQVKLLANGSTQTFTVCGIYQDVTSGGRTAKTVCQFPQEEAEKYSYEIILSGTDGNEFASDMRQQLGNGFSIENMEEFLRQTLGGVTEQLKKAEIAVLLIGIVLTALIVALFLKLRIARESAALAAKKAIGIPFTAICRQELYPVLIAGGFGAAAGVCLAEMLGAQLISSLFGILGIGLKRIVFSNAPAWQGLIVPALLLAVLSLVTLSICTGIKRLDTAGHIND
ncbi:MAG: FtsX-like permease family protein [Bariatricus sp.]